MRSTYVTVSTIKTPVTGPLTSATQTTKVYLWCYADSHDDARGVVAEHLKVTYPDSQVEVSQVANRYPDPSSHKTIGLHFVNEA